jgi:hypothetical protein
MADELTVPPPSNPARCWWRPLVFLAGLGVLVGILYAIGYSTYESPVRRSDKKHLDRMATQSAVVFGSSHAFAILPDKMGLEGVNLAHGGQDVFEMAFMARAVKRDARNLKAVIFVVSYFTFAFDNASYLQNRTQTRIGRRISMYSTFSSYGFIPGDSSAYVKGVLWPLVTRDHWMSIFLPGASRRNALPETGDLPPNPKRDRHVSSARAIEAHAKRRCQNYSALMRNMTSNRPGLEADAFEVLRDVSRELEDSGVRVVLVMPPYADAYDDCFDAKRQRTSRRLAARIASETGAEYVDAGAEDDFTKAPGYFANSDHLNRDGKVAFSRWLGRRLGTIEDELTSNVGQH